MFRKFREAPALEEHYSAVQKPLTREYVPMNNKTNTIGLLSYQKKISVFNKTIAVLFAASLCITNCAAEVLP